MGRTFEEINDTMKEFLENSPVFFVATAPSGEGHINLSPKGLDSFRVIAPRQVAYVDMTGSGVETIAHIQDNGKITLMFMAFLGQPNIIRLYGTATPVYPDSSDFPELLAAFEGKGIVELTGIRSIIRADLDLIVDSCGFGVPLMDFVGHREELIKWSSKKGEEGLAQYRAEKNTQSIDGLPGIPT